MQSIDQAIAHILSAITAIDDTESIPLTEALHRTLAQAAVATVDVPPADVSAMDGYAINCDDLELAFTQGLKISQRIPAGSAPEPLQAHTAARIFTGAVIPGNANAVVIQENCEAIDDKVKVLTPVAEGDNIRRQGQDSKANAQVLASGHRLSPQDLGLLASVGLATIKVKRKLKVAILSSGDELLEPGSDIQPGKIFNSNRYLLQGLLSSLNVEVIDQGLVKDTLEATITALQKAATEADCIISTGGVSVGEEDHLKAGVESIGELQLWKLAIKPGKPLAFGNIAGLPFFGLPGNPVAVFVTFLIVVRPALLKLQGVKLQGDANYNNSFSQQFPANFSISKPSVRQEYLRVRVDGGKIERFSTQDSSVLSSTAWANALAVVPPDTTVEVGDLLDVLPFSGFNL